MKTHPNYFGTTIKTAGHYFWILDGEYQLSVSKIELLNKLPFDPETMAYTGEFEKKYPPKGWAKIYHIDGYSILYIEGSAIDPRDNSKSVFFFKEALTDVELIRKVLSIPAALKLIKAMPFEVKWPFDLSKIDEPRFVPENNLNKKDFWNGIIGQYPKAGKLFCNWIDDYKRAISWELYFVNCTTESHHIKFHDLPLDMQIGIIVRFFWENNMNASIGASFQAIRGYTLNSIQHHFIQMFEMMEKQIASGKLPDRKQPLAD